MLKDAYINDFFIFVNNMNFDSKTGGGAAPCSSTPDATTVCTSTQKCMLGSCTYSHVKVKVQTMRDWLQSPKLQSDERFTLPKTDTDFSV